jgi:hypothetical protein
MCFKDEATGGGDHLDGTLSFPFEIQGIGGRSDIFFFPLDFLSMTISTLEEGRVLTGSKEREN